MTLVSLIQAPAVQQCLCAPSILDVLYIWTQEPPPNGRRSSPNGRRNSGFDRKEGVDSNIFTSFQRSPDRAIWQR